MSHIPGSLEAEVEHLENKVGDFLADGNIAVLTLEQDTNRTVDLVRLSNEIDDVRSSVQIDGLSYLWDHEEDVVSVKMNTANRYDLETVKEIRSRVLAREDARMGVSGWEMAEAGGKMFFIRHFDYPRFSFGLLLDAQAMLDTLAGSSTEIMEEIAFVDAQGQVLASEQNRDSGTDSGDTVLLRRQIDRLDCAIERRILRSDMLSQLPFYTTIVRVLAVLSFLALPALWMALRRLIANPLIELCTGMYEVKDGNLDYRLKGNPGSVQMQFIYDTFHSMTGEIRHLTIESYEKELEKLRTESLNVLLEVNPHMLLNFLNTIYSLASASRIEEVKSFTLLLVSHFRYILRRENAFVTVKDEVNFVTNYKEIQKMRFPDSFTGAYDVDEEAEKAQIPYLLIENFVENSVKYAMIPGKVTEILINIRRQEEWLFISVTDTGRGIEEKAMSAIRRKKNYVDEMGNEHIGIQNCRKWVEYYYRGKGNIRITSSPGAGTQVWIEVPYQEKEPDAVKREENR